MKLEKIDRIKISESFKNDENDTGYFNSGRFQTLFLKKLNFGISKILVHLVIQHQKRALY